MEKLLKSLPRERWALIEFDRVHIFKEYFVSQFGRAKSKDKRTGKETLIVGAKDKRGYRKISARRNGEIETKFIHKEIGKHFVKKSGKKEKPYVVHKDYNKENNDYRNLKWVDRYGLNAYDDQRRADLGIIKKVRVNYNLTEKKVALIKKYLLQGKKTKTFLAEKYGVSITQIRRIETGENWGHVEPKP